MILVLLAACGSGDGRPPASYFSELAPVMRAYHDELALHRASWPGMDDARLSAAYGGYSQSLDEFAAGLDAIEPAGKARDAHDRMAVATRSLAIIYANRSAALATVDASGATPEPKQDFDGREERRGTEWFNACHDLQDLALVDEIDVDLLCVTMLHSNQE